ncbi:Sas10/Utp3/C1D [Penicillium chermesinum]|uniref:Exosome complex protein n=1 Tax=Penicillium chermesinum TaxID=63820 RepID=A0A9W9NHE6_9EURO|nr:Sas10/Utp3/C1D [Penicillium chermesinum]KAJ5219881.1 Sas10/Utp3/C1D [Penicillium chermesinum]KAJ6157341.1 Sas10/Utp3/C1D [Penicillium chermesinum]
MDATALLPLLEQLDDQIDDLEEVLQPVLGQALSKTSSNLPVMDKAKFNVLITYTLESLLFSYLKLHGVDAVQHPVFREITRVKQYFAKIKNLEQPEERNMTLDKEAAGRFIKHGLAGNEKIDLERAEREAKEKARAEVRAAMLAKKSASKSQDSAGQTDDLKDSPSSDDDDDNMSDEGIQAESEIIEALDNKPQSGTTDNEKRKGKRHEEKKKAKKEKKISAGDRKEARKERRAKKQQIRKARHAQKAT